MKASFELNTRVRFIKLPECELTNKSGVILGTSMVDVQDFYIVMLDEPLPNRRAVVMIESCLEKF